MPPMVMLWNDTFSTSEETRNQKPSVLGKFLASSEIMFRLSVKSVIIVSANEGKNNKDTHTANALWGGSPGIPGNIGSFKHLLGIKRERNPQD